MSIHIQPVSSGLFRWFVSLAAVLLIAGCPWVKQAPPEPEKEPVAKVPASGPPIPERNEVVLPEGSVLIAHTAAGRIKIEAGPGSLRVFNWEDARRGVAMKPRDEPFAGAESPGIYYDGKPPVWKPYQGISKVQYEESKRNFETTVDMQIWTQIRRLYFTYNDSGLAVGWKRDGDTLHVEVWQFYIGGELPGKLPGSDNDAITLKSAAQVKKEEKAEEAAKRDA